MKKYDYSLFILPGNSVSNRPWIEHLHPLASSIFNQVTAVTYSHWLTGKPWIDFRIERDALLELVGNKTRVIILGKSVGALLAIQALNTINPIGFIALGLPMKIGSIGETKIEEAKITQFLNNLLIPSLFLQEKNDPYCSYEDLHSALRLKKPLHQELIEIEGNDHSYSDLSRVIKYICCWIEQIKGE